jgi:hypothetical protein
VTVPVTVTNTTASLWPAASTRLGYWLKRPDGSDATTPGSQALTALPADLAPGQTATVSATVTAPAPSTAGNKAEAYTLAWDTYDSATNNWQSSSHLLPQLPQQVGVEDPTSNLLGLEDSYAYTGTATGAGSGFDVNNYAGNVVWSSTATHTTAHDPRPGHTGRHGTRPRERRRPDRADRHDARVLSDRHRPPPPAGPRSGAA